MTAQPGMRSLTCPNCGSALNVRNPQSQMTVCPACNSHVKLGMGTEKVDAQFQKLMPPPRPIKIGDQGMFRGIPCVVLGRISYRGWDTSDPSDIWYWDEWLLGAEDGRMFWLSYYNETGFSLWHKKRIRQGFNVHSSSRIPVKNKLAGVKERYPATVVGAEGELTKLVKPGEQFMMIEAAGGGLEYSIQVSASEIEMYEGAPVDEEEIAQSLQNEKWLQDIKRKQSNRNLYQFGAMACLVFAVVGVVLAIALWGSGSVQEEESFRLDQNTFVHEVPLEVKNAGRPVKIYLDMTDTLPANSYAEIDVLIISPDGEEKFLYTESFWRETGSDSDGAWDESDYSGSRTYIPPETGQYTVKFQLAAMDPQVSDVDMDIQIKTNHIVASWFLGYGIITGIIGILFLMLSAPQSAGTVFNAILSD